MKYSLRSLVHFTGRPTRRAALTNTAPTRPYRSSGRPEVMFVMERLIDLAAHQIGIDRIELRRRNLVPETAMPYTNPFGMVYDSGDYIGAMDHVLRLADWQGLPARRTEARGRGRCWSRRLRFAGGWRGSGRSTAASIIMIRSRCARRSTIWPER